MGPLRVIGVLDLRRGLAVHAVAGDRARYAPVRSVAGRAMEPGSALALARTYIERLGIREPYVADLDAILGGDSQDALVAELAALDVPLWLDAGVSSVARARRVLSQGARHVVVGLETLTSWTLLQEMCAATEDKSVAFSLDLRRGAPIIGPDSVLPRGESARRIARRAVDAGVGALIVLDLSRVGTNRGLNLDLISRVRRATPGLTLLAGGGVRGIEDLRLLADAGCDGALVATALHNGRIGGVPAAAPRGSA
jgi:phosphoribosylformimino-5-aminoimidazole carboxamide ribotide isomerase